MAPTPPSGVRQESSSAMAKLPPAAVGSSGGVGVGGLGQRRRRRLWQGGGGVTLYGDGMGPIGPPWPNSPLSLFFLIYKDP